MNKKKSANSTSSETLIKIPEKLLTWLFYEDSLTEKLRLSTGDASMQVLEHKLHIPGLWEKNVLGINEGLEFLREIVMYSQDICCWYARTIAPQSTYLANKYFFSPLEKSVLHVLLFQEKLTVRQTMECYSISKNDLEFHWVKRFILPSYLDDSSENLILWVRRSCFLIGGKAPFYLVEIFLPQFLDLIA